MTLTGRSGKQYMFSLFSLQSFNDLKDAFKPLAALYVFTKRNPNIQGFTHNLIYLGETGDLSTRYNNHHKEQCITSHGANCIGIFVFNGTEMQRKSAEEDILANYDFPCNEINN